MNDGLEDKVIEVLGNLAERTTPEENEDVTQEEKQRPDYLERWDIADRVRKTLSRKEKVASFLSELATLITVGYGTSAALTGTAYSDISFGSYLIALMAIDAPNYRYSGEIDDAIQFYKRPDLRAVAKGVAKGLALGVAYAGLGALLNHIRPNLISINLQQAMTVGSIAGIADKALTYVYGWYYSRKADSLPEPTDGSEFN